MTQVNVEATVADLVLTGAATEAKQDTQVTALQAIQALIGTAVSDSLLVLLRDIKTNTAAAVVDVAELNLTADQVQLNTDAVETKLDTVHADVAAVLAKLSGDPATQATLAAVLAKLSSDPATQTSLAAFIAANHTDLAAILAKITSDPSTATLQASANTKLDALHTDIATTLLAKNEAMRALLAGTLLVEGSTATEITASTYTSGLLTAYTERRPVDAKTRSWTITRNADGTISTQTVTAWA